MTLHPSFATPTSCAAPSSRGARKFHRLARAASFAGVLQRSALFALALGLATSALAAAPTMSGHDHDAMRPSYSGAASPLVEKVRVATRRYRDINVALGEGWVRATPCVSGPNEGAMGVHFLKPDRLNDGTLKAEEPEMLIYEPQPSGAYRLVGVEYIVLAADWASHNPPGTAPSVDGHLANFVGEPNRYALPAFYEMHVWAWEDNPNGDFSDWNSRVSCASQPSLN